MGSYRNEMDRRERLSREKGKRMAKERNAERNPSPAPMTATPDISALVADLRALRDAMPRSFSASRDIVIRAIDALLALQSENTALRARLEEAEKERDEAREAKAEREYECSCFAAENIRLTVEIDSLISSRMRMKARYRNAAIKAARCAEAAEARIAGLETANERLLESGRQTRRTLRALQKGGGR